MDPKETLNTILNADPLSPDYLSELDGLSEEELRQFSDILSETIKKERRKITKTNMAIDQLIGERNWSGHILARLYKIEDHVKGAAAM